MVRTFFYRLVLINGSTDFFYYFVHYNVFEILSLLVSIITLFTLLIRGGYRIKFSELEGKGKKGKKDSEKGKKSKGKQKNLINDDDDEE